nr:aminoacyl-tRNA synthetase, class 1a, anticodon-binding [Tanacetum cinerariifolium]
MCIIAAKRAGWIVNDHSPCPLRHAGFRLVQADDFDRFQTLSTEVVSLVNLFEEAKSRCKAILVGQAAEKLEHTAEALGYDAVKYAVLKANRLANYTINFDEMLNEKGCRRDTPRHGGIKLRWNDEGKGRNNRRCYCVLAVNATQERKNTHRLVRKRVGKNFVKPGKTRHKV